MIQIEQAINHLNKKIEDEKQKATVKKPLKVGKLFSLLSKTALEHLTEISHKAASKVCKSSYIIFKSICGIRELQVLNEQQKEWVHFLQPRIRVNINLPKDSDSDLVKIEAQDFIDSLKRCQNLEEVKCKFQEAGIHTIEIPLIWEEWQSQINNWHFTRQLGKIYVFHSGKQLIMNDTQIISHLNHQKKEHGEKIKLALPAILDHIHKCNDLDFAEIINYFKRLHIHLDEVNVPDPHNPGGKLTFSPTTKDEWNQCIQNIDFCEALTTQWINHQETTAQLALQGLRQALLSKNHVESKFLFFRGFAKIVDMAFSIIQLTICLPPIMLWKKTTSIIELFLKDLTKLDIPFIGFIHLFHPLYPDVNFRVNSLLITLIEHFFARKYKPNEYSKEGYQLSIQIRKLNFFGLIHLLLSYLEKTVLWLQIQLIEKPIKFLRKNPEHHDESIRFAEIDAKYKKKFDDCKMNIEKLKSRIVQLKIDDFKFSINPQQSKIQGQEAPDPLQMISHDLEEAKFDFFPHNIREFFEENFGFKLTEENKPQIQKNLEKVFSKTEDKFIASYQENRFSYLRV